MYICACWRIAESTPHISRYLGTYRLLQRTIWGHEQEAVYELGCSVRFIRSGLQTNFFPSSRNWESELSSRISAGSGRENAYGPTWWKGSNHISNSICLEKILLRISQGSY